MRVDSVVMGVRAVFSVRLGEFDLFGAFGGDRKTFLKNFYKFIGSLE